jgi:uncharacterized membrane protein
MGTEDFMAFDDVRCFLASKQGWVVTFIVATLAAYLLWAHTGHVLAFAPYLLLLACPLMHLLGHRHGHGSKKEHTHD